MIKTKEDFNVESVEIITVGTEILLGQILNTNARFLAAELRDLGFNAYYQTVVGDNPPRLKAAVKTAALRSDAVIIAGGLGPTQDDISMQTAAAAAGQKLYKNDEAAKDIEDYFTSRGRKMSPNNLKQAYFPKDARIFKNHHGTAPGAAFMYDDEEAGIHSLLILLPGPPNELEPMFRESVKPLLMHYSDSVLDSLFIRTIDIGESDAARLLEDLLDDSHANPSLAPYAHIGEVSFRLSYKHPKSEKNALQHPEVRKMLEEIEAVLGDKIYEIGERKLPEVLADLLKERKLSAAFAESCTAGRVCAELAACPGISAVLKGGVTAYQNEIKRDVLKIPSDLLRRHGAVSAECALAMAENVRTLYGSDTAAAVTGNAGPEPSEGKPVGLVYIAAADEKRQIVKEFRFGGSREKIRTLAAKQTLNTLRKLILDQD